MRKNRQLLISKCIKLLYIFIVLHTSLTFADDTHDWKSEWALDDYFKISIDTEGYHLPTSIAFIPNPGNGPKDPLYFVTELRGRVKVVTNDRSVYTFAEDFFRLKPSRELPAVDGENGLAGICLESENGYVFVTFAYQDANNIIKNNVVRFETKPKTFSLKPSSITDFSHVFAGDDSTYSHQIGPCQVYDNLIYVSVGDGQKILKSQQLDSTLGKIVRMTLDGEPAKTNPFYFDDGLDSSRNYVWAYGLRNPFGLRIVHGRVFVSDNGNNVDRFLEVHEGENYLWDGADWSIGTNADVVFAPSVVPVQIDYYQEDLDIFPDRYRGKFYLALGGDLKSEGPGKVGDRSVVMLDFSFQEDRMLSVPKHFLKYRGEGLQLIVGLGIGPDGLYIVPLFSDKNGQSAILKIEYDESNSHPYKISNESIVHVLLASKGCSGCHTSEGWGWGNVGPNLDREPLIARLKARLNSGNYIESVKELDKLDLEPYNSYKDARREVLEKKGNDKVWTWVKYHLLEPKFDNPVSRMPNVGLTEDEAILLTEFFLKEKSIESNLYHILNSLIPFLRYRHIVYSFILGVSLAFLFLTFCLIAVYVFKKRKLRKAA